ncbi:S-adenosyl-L-methionine-dependent methyltransferase [Aspergillus floccosus]
MPIVLSNPTFFRENGYREPRTEDGLNTPLASYFGKPNYGFFDYLRDHPTVQDTFMSSMQAQVRSTRLASSVYPYAERLATTRPDDSPVAIVDVGGSRGELLQELRRDYPSIQGRMIVQDRPQAVSAVTEPPEGIELTAHDMFAEQPVKGARAYHLKRVLHDWADDQCRLILKHLVAAMDKERSVILIMDAVLPTRNCDFSRAMGDHSMLTFGGKERSEKDWKELLSSVGLEIARIYQGPEPEAVIECRPA